MPVSVLEIMKWVFAPRSHATVVSHIGCFAKGKSWAGRITPARPLSKLLKYLGNCDAAAPRAPDHLPLCSV